MQFIDLNSQQERIRHDLERRILSVLDHGKYIMGPEVAELEAALCSFTGAKHCVTCASGTDALLMPLMAWNIGPGDAVFLPPFTFFATGEMPALLGATPIFVDILPDTYNISPEALRRAIAALKKKDSSLYPIPQSVLDMDLTPKAIIPVDLFGQPADYTAIHAVAEEGNLMVLEDAAQAFGGEFRGKRTCGLGCDAASTSFFPAKPLGCYGDGGAIFTDNDALADLLRSIRVHGKGEDKYNNVRLGLNGRLDTLQAAILLSKLTIFPEELQSRQQVASWYTEELGDMDARVTPPVVASGNVSSWAQYTIRVPESSRDHIAAYLKQRGVPVNIYYPRPMHTLEAFKGLGYAPGDMPVSLKASREVLSLPFHPYMKRQDVQQVVTALRGALS